MSRIDKVAFAVGRKERARMEILREGLGRWAGIDGDVFVVVVESELNKCSAYRFEGIDATKWLLSITSRKALTLNPSSLSSAIKLQGFREQRGNERCRSFKTR